MCSGTPKPNERVLRSNVAVLVVAVLAGALALGVWVPSRWHIPIVAVVGALAMAAASLKLIGLWRLQRNRVNRDLGKLRAELAQSQSAIRDVRQLALTSTQGIARLDARAHNDEVRIRQVAQLAKKAAEYGELFATRMEAAPSGGGQNPRGSRPEVSQVRAADGMKHIGRLAASVSPDGERSRKINQALGFGNSRDGTIPVAAVIGTKALEAFLKMHDTVPDMLIPGYALARLTAAVPTMLIVEEAAFESGPWFGADSSHGTVLFEEICEITRAAKSHRIPIYVLRAHRRTDVYSSEIRRLADYTFPSSEFDVEWGIDAELGIMRDLQRYSDPKKMEQI